MIRSVTRLLGFRIGWRNFPGDETTNCIDQSGIPGVYTMRRCCLFSFSDENCRLVSPPDISGFREIPLGAPNGSTEEFAGELVGRYVNFCIAMPFFVVAMVMLQWRHLFAHNQITAYLDNSAALGALLNTGSSSAQVSSEALRFWYTITGLHTDIWMTLVRSGLNIADPPLAIARYHSHRVITHPLARSQPQSNTCW